MHILRPALFFFTVVLFHNPALATNDLESITHGFWVDEGKALTKPIFTEEFKPDSSKKSDGYDVVYVPVKFSDQSSVVGGYDVVDVTYPTIAVAAPGALRPIPHFVR